jgi:hypothetical protein
MTLDVLLVGLAVLAVGLGLCFAGFPLFLVMLPIWGFVIGFVGAAGATSAALNEGFLASTASVLVGLLSGMILAAVSYAIWWGAVIVLGVSVGYLLGAGVVEALGIGSGLVMVAAGCVGAIVLGVVFYRLRLPRVAVIVITTAAGAVATVAGAMLLLGQVTLDEFSAGTIEAVVKAGPLAYASTPAVMVLGIVAQWQLAANAQVKLWRRTAADVPVSGGEA